MKKNLKNLFCILLIVLINLYPNHLLAISPEWIGVPKSEFGEQLWDKSSIQKNSDGSLRINSKFIAKKGGIYEHEIDYTMDINCDTSTYRDISTSSNSLNEVQEVNQKWNSPNGDPLIKGVINQVCQNN